MKTETKRFIIKISEQLDIDKIKELLKACEYENDIKKVYYFEHWNISSFGGYLQSIYHFNRYKKQPSSKFEYIFSTICKFYWNHCDRRGGRKKNLVTSLKISHLPWEDDTKYEVKCIDPIIVKKLESLCKINNIDFVKETV